MRISKRQITHEAEEATKELITLQRRVLAGEVVPNYEYNEVLKKTRMVRRGNWRVFEVQMTVEAQSDWSAGELKEHLQLIFEDSLLRRYTVKTKMTKGKGRRNL